MLDGITILSETTKCTAGVSAIIAGIFCGIIALILLIVAISAFFDSEISAGIACLLVVLLFGFVSFVAFLLYIDRTSYQEYKVTISDSVKMTDFNSKYKVIDQEGKIYTIIKKK